MKALFFPIKFMLSHLGLAQQILSLGLFGVLPNVVLVVYWQFYSIEKQELMLYLVLNATIFTYLLCGIYLFRQDFQQRLQYFIDSLSLGNFVDRVDCELGDQREIVQCINKIAREHARIVAKVIAATHETHAAAEELLSHAQDSNQASHQQSDAISTISAAIEELSASFAQLDQQLVNTMESSRETKDAAEQGEQSISNAELQMQNMLSGLQNSSTKIGRLEELSGQIKNIMAAINQITDQTNLLALNAAIEAARAGESGRGFAVVADEVRALANTTREAAQEVQTYVDQITKEVGVVVQDIKALHEDASKTNQLISGASQTFSNIRGQSDSVFREVTESSHALNMQSDSTQHIASNIDGISQSAISTYQIAESVMLTASYLSALATENETINENVYLDNVSTSSVFIEAKVK